MAFPLDVVILAAGEGKRMQSALPKVLHPLAGRPLAAYVLATVRSLAPRAIAVVTGFGADAVEQALGSLDLIFVRQEPPRGTGDAARVALSVLPLDGVTLVGLGDVPLVPVEALQSIAAIAQQGRVGLLSARVRNPFGLGRVIRGQVAIATTVGKVRRVRLLPGDPPATRQAVDAIMAADLVVLGPGSWFTSVIPHVLVPQLAAALQATTGRRALVLNLVAEPGETAEFSAERVGSIPTV